jgi:hypothetical protein
LIGFLLEALSFQAHAREPHRLPATAPHIFYDQVITFKKGSAEISKSDQETLLALQQAMKEKSQKVEQVHVAVWSDLPFPKAASLSERDRALAESRIMAIEDFLEGPLGLSYVESYNLAERSNWFAKALNTDPREIKSLFAQKGAPKNVTPDDFSLVKTKGGPSKAVLLFELEAGMVMSGTD